MSSGLTDDDRKRIETFSETPSHARSPEDLVPEQKYTDDVRTGDDESRGSLLDGLLAKLRER